MKLAALGILHETNTFSSIPTDDEAFEQPHDRRHPRRPAGAGGLGRLRRDRDHDRRLQGRRLAARRRRRPDRLRHAPGPFGTWPRSTFERVAGAQIARLEAEGPFDGILMAQHGACVAEGYPDGDAEMIRRVREVVGPRVPIGNVMDTHGNVSPAQVHGADITLLWRTNPHLDCRERGLQLAELIAQTVRGELQPVQAVVNPPMLANILAQNTGDEPMKGLLRAGARAHRRHAGPRRRLDRRGLPLRRRAAHGHGARRDRRPRRVDRPASRRDDGRATWEQRQAFDPRGVAVADAVRLERPPDAKGPILLLDVGDNMGAGTPGDSTFILEGLLREGRRNWLLTVVDPAAVAACVRPASAGTST